MPIIDVDTDQLRGAVSTAEITNEAISEAVNLLERIMIHNDWVCKEREQINENTRQYQNKSREIMEQSAALYQAIKQSSELFDETERADTNKLNKLDELIAAIATVVQGGGGGFRDGGISPSIVDFSNMAGSMAGKEE